MQILADLLNTIPAINSAAMSRAQRHVDGLLKPVGSLGKLEALAIQLAGMPGLNGIPHVGKKAVLVMCADHGVWEEGVAISPKEVTAIQAENMTRGTTGVCVLAAQAGANVHVIDVGIDTAEPIPGLINMRVARGSGNIASAPAMSRRQAEKLLLDVICYTRELARELRPRGIRVMAVSPGWVKTEFFDHALQTSNDAVTYYNRLYEAKDVMKTALHDLYRTKKDVSIHGLPVRWQVRLVKLLPHKLVMDIWMKQQKHNKLPDED